MMNMLHIVIMLKMVMFFLAHEARYGSLFGNSIHGDTLDGATHKGDI